MAALAPRMPVTTYRQAGAVSATVLSGVYTLKKYIVFE